MTKRHEKTLARRQAVQMLYQSEIVGATPSSIMAGNDTFGFVDDMKPSEYARTLVNGVPANQARLDRVIEEYAKDWSIDRMPVVDRVIMRVACFELFYVDDVPDSVVINEAVELAKDFGGEDESHRFVNGVLGVIVKQLQDDSDLGMKPFPSPKENTEEASNDAADEVVKAKPANVDDEPQSEGPTDQAAEEME